MTFLLAIPESKGQATYEFGFSLNPTAQGGLHALFIYNVKDGVVLGSIPMRSDFFVLQASGLMESKANLESIDLFDTYGIRDCGVWAANGMIDANLDCLPLKDIWKLRYKNGMGAQEGTGWASEEFRPSDRQQVILQFYRPAQYDQWHGPYFGKDAFRLLRDMQDPAWVDTYQNGG
ncbi:MAG: hypothetical protein IPH05_08755 [Flavobacteriales bacterium]|jgi:hypothetical protein|nr:hypothetical protein [Flavobacteriales bacterium]MBK7114359.1 hypothetical protein [Flavobacteriales bacterium]MBK7483580.1 hypothetical protein [Flavobacteriales bacterium]MBK7620957.1 hypothetical protein [Flavobacteriales bacterium]MBK9628513.1 hypothetical protein [Flavobacteriales bacterium]